MNDLIKEIRRAATLLSNGMDRVEVSERLEKDGVSSTQAILIVIAAEQFLKNRTDEDERLEKGWFNSPLHPLDKMLPDKRKEKGKIE